MLCGDIESNPGPTKKFECILLNSHSLKSVNARRNKLVEFRTLVELKQPSLVGVCETWLNRDIKNTEILPPDQYKIYRKDRKDGYGGILLAVNNDIQSKRKVSLEVTSDNHNEIMVIEARAHKQPKMAVILMYRPPDDISTECSDNLRMVLNNVQNAGFKNICLIGDINIPNYDWDLGIPTSSNNKAETYYNIFQDFSLEQLVKSATHINGNILDLVLTNFPNKFKNLHVEKETFSSDHYLVHFTINMIVKNLPKISRHVYNFKQADWIKVNEKIREANLEEIVNTSGDDIDLATEKWTQAVIHVLDESIKKCKIKNINSPPWIDGEVIHLSNKKERLRRKAKKSDNVADWNSYKTARNELKNLVNKKYNAYIENSSEDIAKKPKLFWKLLKSKTKTKHIPDRLSYQDKLFSKPEEKAKGFNDYFESVFIKTDRNTPLPNVNSFQNLNLMYLQIADSDVLKILKEIDPSKATGPDNIPGIVLKLCAESLCKSLTMLYNMSLQKGCYPKSWKAANVTPVFKKGERENMENYRPISLLCIVSKVMEKCIYKKLIFHVKDLLHPLQHGFLKGKSTITQLLSVYEEIEKSLDGNIQTDVIFLDFSKAFDTVSHILLIHKLTSFGVCGPLLNWMKSYLTNRTQRVVVDGVSSAPCFVSSGVPQGSILGPLLFLIYINDMANEVSVNTDIAFYADDAKVTKKIYSTQDGEELQADLSRLINWSQRWLMNFNTAKCKIMSITRRMTPVIFNYSINDTLLEHVNSFNDLGIIVDKNLKWDNYIKSKVSKANSMLGLVKRTLGFRAPIKAKKLLYNSLVKSVFDYGSIIWNGCSKECLGLIEGVQRRATKYILLNYEMDYKSRLQALNMLPLCYTFEMKDLVFFYKCINNQYDFSIHNVLDIRQINTRTMNGLSIIQHLAKTETYKHFYTNRIVKLWNLLPADIKQLECSNRNASLFKNHLNRHYMCLFNSNFDTENTCTWVTYCRCPICRPI